MTRRPIDLKRQRAAMRKIARTWKSWAKKRLDLQKGIGLTPYVSFLHSNMEGTYTRHGVVIGFFNGYTKKALGNRNRCFHLSVLSNLNCDPKRPPASNEPHALVLIEDSVRGEEFFSEVWVPLSRLTFVPESAAEYMDSLHASARQGLEILKEDGKDMLSELWRLREEESSGKHPRRKPPYGVIVRD